MLSVKTKLVKGFQIASGTSETDNRFPGGSIRMQEPFFKEQGLDLQDYFDGQMFYGTMNLSFAPQTVRILKPEYFMDTIKWTDHLTPENFFLSPAKISVRGTEYKAMIYIPDPATKPDHFNPPTMVDVLSVKIDGLALGDEALLTYNENAIELVG